MGAVIAGIIGSRFANKIDEQKLNRVVAWVFIGLGIIMIGMKFIRYKILCFIRFDNKLTTNFLINIVKIEEL